jgi:ribonuclease T
MQDAAKKSTSPLTTRFRGFLPVVVDVETGGFDWNRHALLEIAVCPIDIDELGKLFSSEVTSTHVVRAIGVEMDPKWLELNGIILVLPFGEA